MSYTKLELYIDGQWISGGGRACEPVLDPATEEVLGMLPLAGTADLDHALAAAERALPAWSALPAYQRGRILKKAADLIRERLESIAAVLTREQGKSIRESRIEVALTADIFEWMAEEGRRAYGRIIPSRDPDLHWSVFKEPVGVVAAFSPWNFPGTTPSRKMAGPLAAGCCCILKASEETPGTAIELTRALHDAGLPAGVFNLVFGVPAEVSQYLIASPIVRKVTFTGSTAVGKHLAALSAQGLKSLTMELGGHAPVIVFDDVDVERVVRLAVGSKFRNAGQVCVSPSRIFVHERIMSRFAERFASLAADLRVGSGLDEGNAMGPLANPRRLQAMETYLDDAAACGARVLAGGSRRAGKGYFWEPTVLADIPPDARLLHEEPFGPVASLIPFGGESEVLARSNSLAYGLASYVFTSDLDRATRVSHALHAGLVGINTFTLSGPETPWGGVGDSGYGREGGIEGLEGYMHVKTVSQATPFKPV
ncbi:Alpha-ketoglutaric semialdehyde dehydrogenase [Pigmentiphaga humi]|uniref:Alpha-ketoglutaric semialdehyde dehydrogenase n=1 Tax=Pigmentiphaga humi TaxID=2478468 RepID=A0A3P4B3J9_9BURK|nr:Alpha-ketoglutaric semialdehyde dehydrogenase [Pigmentiphaga humi]